jgi:universal stress protein E
LSILDVIQIPEKEISRLNSRLKGSNLESLVIEDSKASIAALLKEDNFTPSRVDIVFGVPFIKIIQHVQKYNFDLIVTTAEGGSGIKDKLFGTTSLHLLRKCPCPVWILKPRPCLGYRNILVAVDPVDQDDTKQDLNRKIMELATSMAEIEKAELHVVHTWEMEGESLLINRGLITRQEMDNVVREEETLHQKATEELVAQHPATNISRKTCVLRGKPGDAIPAYIEENNIDLVVMGTVSRQGIAGLLIGNTAEQVLQKVNASVLTVKPKGFVTPVQS